MKATKDCYRHNVKLKDFAFAEQYLSFNGYTTICPHCKQKLVLTQLSDEDKDNLKNKKIIDYHCFMCDKDFKIRIKQK